MNNTKKITYVFLQGRKQRINARKEISKEFFYTYFYAVKNYTNVEIVEMENFEPTISQKFLRKVYKALSIRYQKKNFYFLKIQY